MADPGRTGPRILKLNRGPSSIQWSSTLAVFATSTVAVAIVLAWELLGPRRSPFAAIIEAVLLIAFLALALLSLLSFLHTKDGATLRLDSDGVHLVRGLGWKAEIPWNRIALVQFGPRLVQLWALGTPLVKVAFALSVRGKKGFGSSSIDVNDILYNVRKEDLNEIAARASGARVESPEDPNW